VEVVSSGEGDDPEAGDEGADGEDPFADGTVVVGEAGGFANAVDLAQEADGHEEDADGESEPGHGHGICFYLIWSRCGKREVTFSSRRRGGLRGRMRITAGILAIALAGGGGALAGAQTSASQQSSQSDPCLNHQTVAILSVMPDADLEKIEKVYVPALVSKTKKQWYPLIPPDARPPQNKQGCVQIQFVVHPDGKVSGVKLSVPSGNVGMDRAAWKAIADAAPYAAFPEGVTVSEVKMQLNFLYNEKSATADR